MYTEDRPCTIGSAQPIARKLSLRRNRANRPGCGDKVHTYFHFSLWNWNVRENVHENVHGRGSANVRDYQCGF